MTAPDLHQLRKRYRNLSEPELMDVARGYDELTSEAQALVREEFTRRSLEPPLIEDEPGEHDQVSHPELVMVGQYRDASEGIVARAALESEGIPCFLQDENTIRMDWLWSNLIGGLRLKVAAEDESAAREILSQPQLNPMPLAGGAEFVQPVCPKCESGNVALHAGMLKPAAATLLVTGVPLLPVSSSAEMWRCMHCGCIWTDDKEYPEGQAE